MVNIDTVYQKVLIFANKEQRGYITPQEFNLFADQAQKEIFEQYFYDLNQFSRIHGNSEEYADIKHILQEKIAIFERTGTITTNTINANNLYRLGTVIDTSGREIEEVQQNEILYLQRSPLTAPRGNRRVYVRTGLGTIDIYPPTTNATCTYLTKPTIPKWNYVVVNNKAMYNSSNTVHFDLHTSEENELVYKILKFAGISMKRDDVTAAAQTMEQLQVQQEKQ
tara:strand:+ start:222 stop:893 length:672 start_codon:yes stop_codon:yes gene_type:complete